MWLLPCKNEAVPKQSRKRETLPQTNISFTCLRHVSSDVAYYAVPASFFPIPTPVATERSLSDQIPNFWVAKLSEIQNVLPNGYEVVRQQKGHENSHETAHVQLEKPGHKARRQRKNTEKNLKILLEFCKGNPDQKICLRSQIKKFFSHWKLLVNNLLRSNGRFGKSGEYFLNTI